MSGNISDWRRVHAELLRIAERASEASRGAGGTEAPTRTARVALDRDEGQWLLTAQRAGVHRRLGFATFAEYVERVFVGAAPTWATRARAPSGLRKNRRLLEEIV